jgi:hypothetical protein
MPISKAKPTKSTPSAKSDVTTQAASALDSIRALSAALPIDDAIPPNQMAATKVTSRVPLEAMTIAAAVLANNAKQFPQFDGTEAQAAIDYETAMVPVAQAALVLSKRITKSVLKRRSGTAHQTLALYQVMKGTSRLSANEETRTQVEQLKKLFTTRAKSRAADVTQAEAEKMVKTAKSKKKQAVAEAKAADASNVATIATAHATLDAAVAAGTVHQFVAAVTAPSSPAAPAATAAAPAATVAGGAPAAAPATIAPSH